MTIKQKLGYLLSVVILSACSENTKPTLEITNSLNIDRSSETIELSKEFLKVEDLSSVGIQDAETKELQVTQLVDNDGDGTFDDLLFQPQIKANSSKAYNIVTISETDKPKAEALCYSRFVPERTDDYTWENNKVAFRVYGPTAQKIVEDSLPGGTLSSGVDAWLKKVEYPIINKWYKEHFAGVSSYHEDAGEGLDNFHVGVSRGVGGIAAKVDSTYYYSKNYTKWRTITTGPIRTSFYLEYQDWNAADKTIKESRIISLDLNNNLSKFAISLEGSNEISAGITLHEKDGNVVGNKANGWVSYWQPHADSEIGTAIVASKGTFLDFENYQIDKPDLSNAYASLKVDNNEVVYYAGFAWKESGQYKTQEEWEAYLNVFAQQLENPLKVELK
ncbi:DUF4861 domain-containing protein [Seonamhaeicola sp. MEBiC1930]|uniref:DUF4861 family protein n=1 Tax=Seonamhaeicola sp. MEBiC01930 TaxID=2976768 RepID=UPI00324E8431